MTDNNKHTDDFKKLFDTRQMAELPSNLEDSIMAGIEIQKLRAKQSTPHWLTSNLVIFSISICLLVVISVFQFTMDTPLVLLHDIRLMLLMSTIVFAALWFMQLAENVLMRKFAA